MAAFNYNGTELYYEVHGNPDGVETVAFLNGVMASVTSWSLLYPIFERFGFRVILHDFKGQLKSSKPEGPYTFEEHCQEAAALFAHLGVERVHLVGTSYGGEIAMKFAVLYPEFVKSITVIDSVSEQNAVLRGFLLGWKTLCDTGDGELFFHGMAPSIYGPTFLAANQDMLAQRAKAVKLAGTDYLQGQKILYDAFLDNAHLTQELPKIHCPALILCGEDDILKPPSFSKIIADHIPNAEYLTVPDCGHVAIFEKPKELESAIFGFIMKHSGV